MTAIKKAAPPILHFLAYPVPPLVGLDTKVVRDFIHTVDGILKIVPPSTNLTALSTSTDPTESGHAKALLKVVDECIKQFDVKAQAAVTTNPEEAKKVACDEFILKLDNYEPKSTLVYDGTPKTPFGATIVRVKASSSNP